jgi:hypothetical protein
VIDPKQYRGRLKLDGSGRLWHGRSRLALPCARSRLRPTKRPRSYPTWAWRWCRSWLSMMPRSTGQGGHERCAGGAGPAPAKHAPRASGGAGPRAGRGPGPPGPGPLPRRRLSCNACRVTQPARMWAWQAFSCNADWHSPVCGTASPALRGYRGRSTGRLVAALVPLLRSRRGAQAAWWGCWA